MAYQFTLLIEADSCMRWLAYWQAKEKGAQSLPAYKTNLTVDSPSAAGIKLRLVAVDL